jgi:hypothetical protein
MFLKSEIELLSKVCQCSIHQMKWFNPRKYLSCKTCYGCLEDSLDDHPPNNKMIQLTIEKT